MSNRLWLQDIDAPFVLQDVAHHVADAHKDLILLFTTADPNAISLTRQNLRQLQSINLKDHTLLIVNEPEACQNFSHRFCFWSSRIAEKAPADSVSLSKYWDGRFKLYDAKKHTVASLFRLGFGVLQADTDVSWTANPFPVLRKINASIVIQRDGPFVNAGVMYARRRSSAAEFMLDFLAWRIRAMQRRPELVKDIVSWAEKPLYANSDDQTALNDAVISGVLGNYSLNGFYSIAKYEAKSKHNPRAKVNWSDRPEAAQHHKAIANVRKKCVYKRIEAIGKMCYLPLLGSSDDFVVIASPHLFGDMARPGAFLTHFAAARGFAAKRSAMIKHGAWKD